MLSFDISDRQINVVKGANVGGKIRIDRSLKLDIDPDMIQNGEILNLSGVADIITTNLKAENMMDRDAIISFSSSAIVFKELTVPRAKGEQLLTMVQNQMIHEMGLTDEYSISYTIVGDAGEEDPGALKVLATACPAAIVDSYRKVFNIMSIKLRSVNICCNSITRIVLQDSSNLERMPLLVIQINKDFLGMTLFENGQMAFARYTPISEDDYDGDNYIFEALNENIFRMTQFNRARGGSGVSNVILYGEIGDYKELADSLEQMEVRPSILGVPNNITGFENFEFTEFANAIGALYKRNKATEKINLLEIDSQTGRSSAGLNNFLITVGICVAASIVVLFGITFLVGLKEKSVRNDIADVQKDIDSTKSQIEEYQKYNDVYDGLVDYNVRVKNADAALRSLPIITKAEFDKLADKMGAEITYQTFTYNIAGNIVIGNITMGSQSNPRALIKALVESGDYADVAYSGWTQNEETGAVQIPSLTLTLKEKEVAETTTEEAK